MQIVFVEELLRHLQLRRPRSRVGQRRLRRLLHHFPKVPGQGQFPVPRERRGLDRQDIASGGCCGKPGYNPDFILLANQLVAKVWRAEEFVQQLGRNDDAFGCALGHPTRHASADGADLPLQRANAGLTRVAIDYPLEHLARCRWMLP
jgi:hypothetical protein